MTWNLLQFRLIQKYVWTGGWGAQTYLWEGINMNSPTGLALARVLYKRLKDRVKSLQRANSYGWNDQLTSLSLFWIWLNALVAPPSTDLARLTSAQSILGAVFLLRNMEEWWNRWWSFDVAHPFSTVWIQHRPCISLPAFISDLLFVNSIVFCIYTSER